MAHPKGSAGGASRSAGGAVAGPSLEERKHANAVAKGVRVLYTPADMTNAQQSLATAERKLAEYQRKPPRNVFGIDRNAITMAESNVRNLRGGIERMSKPGAWRRSNHIEAWLAGKDRLTARRVARRNAEFFSRLEQLRRGA